MRKQKAGVNGVVPAGVGKFVGVKTLKLYVLYLLPAGRFLGRGDVHRVHIQAIYLAPALQAFGDIQAYRTTAAAKVQATAGKGSLVSVQEFAGSGAYRAREDGESLVSFSASVDGIFVHQMDIFSC